MKDLDKTLVEPKRGVAVMPGIASRGQTGLVCLEWRTDHEQGARTRHEHHDVTLPAEVILAAAALLHADGFVLPG